MKLILSVLAVIVIGVGAALWMTSGQDSKPKTPTGAAPPTVNQSVAEKTVPTQSSSNADDLQTKINNKEALSSDDKDDLKALNPNYPTLEMRLDEMAARRGGQNFDPDAVMEALQKSAAWETGNAEMDKLDLSEEEMNDGREFIRFDRLKLETLVNGDTMELPISQIGQTYQTRITQAQSNTDGSVTWHGTLMGGDTSVTNSDGEGFDVTITSGKKMVSGGIFTPEGHFVIEAVDDQGWIANASTLFKHNESDAIVPPNAAQP